MRLSILLIVLACNATALLEAANRPSAKPDIGIEIELLARKRIVSVRLVNKSKEPLTVLSQGFTFRGVAKRVFHWEVVLGLAEKTRHKGRVIVPALGKY